MVTITIVEVNDRIFSNTGFMQTLQAAMKDADVTTEQLDWLVLHQANQRILDAAAQRIGISSERVVSNLAEYGNTSAASIPLAFDEAVRGGKIKSGDTVGMSAPDSDIHGHDRIHVGDGRNIHQEMLQVSQCDQGIVLRCCFGSCSSLEL